MSKKQATINPKTNGCRRDRDRMDSHGCRRRRMRKYDTEATKAIVRDYGHVVKFIAHKLAYNLPPSVEVDDLISVGLIGLMDAAERFDATKGYKFTTFAEFRIRGAMLDELRRQDFVPRAVREKVKKVEEAEEELRRANGGKEPSSQEISNEIGMSQDKVVELRSHRVRGAVVNFDEVTNLSQDDQKEIAEKTTNIGLDYSPYEFASRKIIRQVMEKVIGDLPDREARILSMYYFEELSLKEIGKALAVTESRVSQLHTRALTSLKTLLDQNEEYAELKELLA